MKVPLYVSMASKFLILRRNPRALARGMNVLLRFLLRREPRTLVRRAPLAIIFIASLIFMQTYFFVPSVVAQGCTFDVYPYNVEVDEGVSSGSIRVTATSNDCLWTASSDSPWISITFGSNNKGSSTVSYSVEPNDKTAPRSGTLRVASETVRINQRGLSCTYELSSSSASHDAGESSGSFDLRVSNDACLWSARSDADWISITAGASGRGSGKVSYTLSANEEEGVRSGSIDVEGRRFQISQEGCSLQVSFSGDSLEADSGTFTIPIEASSRSCPWEARSSAEWLTITSALSGTGRGSITCSYKSNPGPSIRSGSITIGRKTINITQRAPCILTISPAQRVLGPDKSSGNFYVKANTSSCAWTANSDSNWITIMSGHSGRGNGVVTYSVSDNYASISRIGYIKVGNTKFGITQKERIAQPTPSGKYPAK